MAHFVMVDRQILISLSADYCMEQISISILYVSVDQSAMN